LASTKDYYTANARHLFERYESLASEQVHAAWLDCLPDQAGAALDIGAGSGRDAAWLASRGWEVVAVEPCAAFRKLAAEKHRQDNILWIDDRLPSLRMVRAMNTPFRLILVGAVWMHLTPRQQEKAFRVLSDLLAPGGILVITLRHGTVTDDRKFHPISAEILRRMATARTLQTVLYQRSPDAMDRHDVRWEILVFRLPDDGTGSLPLLRHIVVNDEKASTYKLALLRVLVRIADGAPGMVLSRNDDWVTLPFGLLGLYWIKLFKPLILDNHFRQHANPRAGFSFARSDFRALAKFSVFDLRVGRAFAEDSARIITGAIRDACRTIQIMPAHYTKWPGSSRPVFEAEWRTVRTSAHSIILNKEFLTGFGSFRVPASLWQAFSHLACWLEPAINREWITLMEGYNGAREYGTDEYHRALTWDEGRRDTTEARQHVESLVQRGKSVHCVWCGNRLRDSRHFEIDHCLPWAYWYNNDLWNLMPANVTCNGQKRNMLPSAELLLDARERITDWWQQSWLQEGLETRFAEEAKAALPLPATGDLLERVLTGLQIQRMRLRIDQQIKEWSWSA
jgi:SAM-dependent methyltransferase